MRKESNNTLIPNLADCFFSVIYLFISVPSYLLLGVFTLWLPLGHFPGHFRLGLFLRILGNFFFRLHPLFYERRGLLDAPVPLFLNGERRICAARLPLEGTLLFHSLGYIRRYFLLPPRRLQFEYVRAHPHAHPRCWVHGLIHDLHLGVGGAHQPDTILAVKLLRAAKRAASISITVLPRTAATAGDALVMTGEIVRHRPSTAIHPAFPLFLQPASAYGSWPW
jgi:hypothetical protein